jgi:ABC-type oligopeptide transport system ATPase subunit
MVESLDPLVVHSVDGSVDEEGINDGSDDVFLEMIQLIFIAMDLSMVESMDPSVFQSMDSEVDEEGIINGSVDVFLQCNGSING